MRFGLDGFEVEATLLQYRKSVIYAAQKASSAAHFAKEKVPPQSNTSQASLEAPAQFGCI